MGLSSVLIAVIGLFCIRNEQSGGTYSQKQNLVKWNFRHHLWCDFLKYLVPLEAVEGSCLRQNRSKATYLIYCRVFNSRVYNFKCWNHRSMAHLPKKWRAKRWSTTVRPHRDDAEAWELKVMKSASELQCNTGRLIGESGTIKTSNEPISKVMYIRKYLTVEIVQNGMKASHQIISWKRVIFILKKGTFLGRIPIWWWCGGICWKTLCRIYWSPRE